MKFFQIGLNLFGKVLAYCDDSKAAITLGKQIGFISNDENDYFFKCLEQLKDESLHELQNKVSQMLLEQPITLPEVQKYNELLTELTYESKSYVELITYMYTMEKVYLGWADYSIDNKLIPANITYKHKEWIRLHSGDDFSNWVAFLKSEVDRVVKSPEDREISERVFVRALDHEIAFFNACYNYDEQ